MSFNPLEEQGIPLDRQLRNWRELNVQPFNTRDVDPFTRCRAIVMNGAEMEAMWFSRQFSRHCTDIDIKRKLAQTRRVEMQQQKVCNWLIPGDENTIETTIGYEQVAVELTAAVGQMETDNYARRCYEFALLEDFDHLYRYANLLDMQNPRKAAEIVGQLTEIMPGRPTVQEHRHPHDDIRKPLAKNGNPMSILHAMTVTAAEQQTLNFYCNVGNVPQDPVGRGLYLEIAQIEEQHVSHYESLIPPDATWAERLVMHDYNECWLYWSFARTETDPRIQKIWELHLDMEIEHLKQACELMKMMDRRDPMEILPPSLDHVLEFKSNKEYVRRVLAEQVGLTADGTEFVPVSDLPSDHRYHWYQKQVNVNGSSPSEQIVSEHRNQVGGEYRLQTEGPHPVDHLRAAE